jgi:hypothetical protein
MHAAGVVISPERVDNFVPLSRASDESITTQYTMTTLEELGLLKMDFLGLRTLTVIQNAVKLIQREQKSFDISKIDYEDKRVYDFLMIPEEVTSKIVKLDEIKALLEKDADELKDALAEAPYPVKENVAITAKKFGLDSKKKTQVIEETTGFHIDEQPFDE